MTGSSTPAASLVPHYLQQTTYGQLLFWRLHKSSKASASSGLTFSSKPEDFDYNLQRLSKAGVLGTMPSRYVDYQNLSRLFGFQPNGDSIVSDEDNEDAVVMDEDRDEEDEDENKTREEEPETRTERSVNDSIRYNYAMMDIDYDDEDNDEELDDASDRHSSGIFGDANDDHEVEDDDSVNDLSRSTSRRRKRSRSRSSILNQRPGLFPMNFLKHYPLPYKLEKPSVSSSSNSASSNCSLSSDGLTFTFPSNMRHNGTILIKSNNLVPSKTGLFYFETTILPFQNSDTFLSPTAVNLTIGVILSDVHTPSKIPGLESGSFGFNGQDGTIAANQTLNRSFSSPFGFDDVIGCGIDYTNGLIFFTKNGVDLGVAFRDIIDDLSDDYDDGKSEMSGMIPVFGVKGMPPGGIKVNFGTNGEGFRFDIEGYLANNKYQMMKKVLGGDIDKIKSGKEERDVDIVMKELVGEYFDHLGYVDISKTFKKEVLEGEQVTLKAEIDEEVLKIRQSIRDNLLNGEIDQVINLIHEKFPKVFTNKADLLFRLSCLKFINYIKLNEINDAITYGQQLRLEYTATAYQEYLNDISSLLAYPNPENSEFGHLLQTEELLSTLDVINSEILQTLGKENISDLERLVRHDGALLGLLVEKGKNESLVLRLDDFLE